MLDTEQFTRMLQKDNENVANSLLNIVRQNIAMYDVGSNKAKFLKEKKDAILEELRHYDQVALRFFYNELAKMNSRQLRNQTESQIATENRSFVQKIKKDFDRTDSYRVIKNKNLGISEA